jgi:hypothetical protein
MFQARELHVSDISVSHHCLAVFRHIPRVSKLVTLLSVQPTGQNAAMVSDNTDWAVSLTIREVRSAKDVGDLGVTS